MFAWCGTNRRTDATSHSAVASTRCEDLVISRTARRNTAGPSITRYAR